MYLLAATLQNVTLKANRAVFQVADYLCQNCVKSRKGIDLVNDNPENNLMREVDTIKSCQDKMRKTLEQVNHQLGVNRNSRHQLERDLANKDQAISIGKVDPMEGCLTYK